MNMKNLFLKIKEKLTEKIGNSGEEGGEEYVEVGPEATEGKSKIIVRPFVLQDFDDIKPILDDLREGYTVALVNIRPLKEKDIVELKRAINKLKKTTEAIEGDIAGFGEDYIVVTPSFAKVYRSSQTEEVQETNVEAPRTHF
jgi:SepF-like predicted cell division protein (DUF552 family)